jgi:hypothetical protein
MYGQTKPLTPQNIQGTLHAIRIRSLYERIEDRRKDQLGRPNVVLQVVSIGKQLRHDVSLTPQTLPRTACACLLCFSEGLINNRGARTFGPSYKARATGPRDL